MKLGEREGRERGRLKRVKMFKRLAGLEKERVGRRRNKTDRDRQIERQTDRETERWRHRDRERKTETERRKESEKERVCADCTLFKCLEVILVHPDRAGQMCHRCQ